MVFEEISENNQKKKSKKLDINEVSILKINFDSL